MKRPPPRPFRCTATNTDGRRCRGRRAAPGYFKDLCAFHLGLRLSRAAPQPARHPVAQPQERSA